MITTPCHFVLAYYFGPMVLRHWNSAGRGLMATTDFLPIAVIIFKHLPLQLCPLHFNNPPRKLRISFTEFRNLQRMAIQIPFYNSLLVIFFTISLALQLTKSGTQFQLPIHIPHSFTYLY